MNDLAGWLRRHGPTRPGTEERLVVDHGDGAAVRTINGEELLDFSCGALLPLGHPGPAVEGAALGPGQENPDRITLMHKLAELVPGGMNRRVLLCDSGREALARAVDLACAERGGGRAVYLADIRGEAEAGSVRGAAAVIAHPLDARLDAAAALCRESGALLVDDETGIAPGTTGSMTAIEHTGVRPDVFVFGRGLAAGLPLGACITGSSNLRWRFVPDGGSANSCRAALHYVSRLESGLLARARELGTGLRSRLERIFPAERVAGTGLYLGLRFPSGHEAERFLAGCRRRGLLLGRAGEPVVGVWPPLVTSDAEMDRAAEVVNSSRAEMGSP